MDMSTRIAKIRLNYHANMVSMNNVLNQLNIISDERAEERNKNHVIIIILTDIYPRLGKDAGKIFENFES